MNSKIKIFIKTHFPQPIVKLLKVVKQKYIKILRKDIDFGQKVSLGNLNPGKTFYVIRSYDKNWGPLATWTLSMPHVLYAKRKGYIPIFDYKNSKNLLSLIDKEDEGKINAWDLYFEQPQKEYTLQDILKSKNVIFAPKSCPNWSWTTERLTSTIPMNVKEFKLWRNLYETCSFNIDIISYAEKLKEKIFPKGKKVLAVSYRREFEWHHYWNSELTPVGSHLIRSSFTSLIDLIKQKLDFLGYEYFFFTVDDRETMTIMKQIFGEKCLVTERIMPHFFENGKPVAKNDVKTIYREYGKRNKDVYLRTKEYLSNVYLCSQCDSLLSCGSSVDFLAYIINNNKYEYLEQINGVGDTACHGKLDKEN